MLQAFRIVTFICTILFGLQTAADNAIEYRKALLIAGVLFLAATIIQVRLGL